MPLVTFTPRVRVSRMCTPSRIPLASSVRRISVVISSSDGICCEGQRMADRRSRLRCSVSLKMRPVVQPKALPHRVATLHRRVERADPRLVTVGEPATHVDDDVAVALVKGLLQRISFRA